MTKVGRPQLRSVLFVPAHRDDKLRKALNSDADAVILDLEDSVPPEHRGQARANVASLTAIDTSARPRLCVRINALSAGGLDADLAAAIGVGLLAVVVPKVEAAADVERIAAEVDRLEAKGSIVRGSIAIWPLIENAAAVLAAAQIATASRVAYMGGGTSPGGDLAASLGFQWSSTGWETMYLRSKLLVDVRAAGVAHPVTGVFTQLDDLAGLRAFADQSKGLGYEGLMVIHPSHVAVANEVFGTSAPERAAAAAMIAALDQGAANGQAAVTHEGRMIDEAMRAGAEQVLKRRPARPAGDEG